MNHLKSMIAKIFSYVDSEIWRAVVAVFAEQIQEVDDTTLGIIEARNRPLALLSGQMLLQEGKLFNVSAPDTTTEAARRLFIAGAIASQNSTGRISDILQICADLTSAADGKLYNYSGVYFVECFDPVVNHFIGGEITHICQQATAAGNRCEYILSVNDDTFIFDDAAKGLDNGIMATML